DAYRDTTEPIFGNSPIPANEAPYWYPKGVNEVKYDLGNNRRRDRQFILSMQWTSFGEFLGATPSYGLELERTGQERRYRDVQLSNSGTPGDSSFNRGHETGRDLTYANALYRLRWRLAGNRSVETSLGAAAAWDSPRAGGVQGGEKTDG